MRTVANLYKFYLVPLNFLSSNLIIEPDLSRMNDTIEPRNKLDMHLIQENQDLMVCR